MKKVLIVTAAMLLALSLMVPMASATGPPAKNSRNCIGFFAGGFSPGAVGAFVPANASVNGIAVGNGNCGVHGPA